MSEIRVGVLGCGRIVQAVHLSILASTPSVEVVALADPNGESLEAARNRVPGASAHHDYREVLEIPDLDAVVIGLPTGLHGESASLAFQAGKHVYLEKPLATSRSEGGAVLRAWRESGRVGVMGFNYRFHPLHRRLRDQLVGGRIGELVGVRSSFCTPPRALPEWKTRRETGGGVLFDLASHHLDLLPHLLQDPVRSVSAHKRSIRTEDDTAALQLTLASGVTVQSFFSMTAPDEDRIELIGEGGKLVVDRYRSLDVEFTDPVRGLSRPVRLASGIGRALSGKYALRKMRNPGMEPSFRTSLESFVTAVRGEPSESPDMEDGYRSLLLVEASEISARTGDSVLVDEMEAYAS